MAIRLRSGLRAAAAMSIMMFFALLPIAIGATPANAASVQPMHSRLGVHEADNPPPNQGGGQPPAQDNVGGQPPAQQQPAQQQRWRT